MIKWPWVSRKRYIVVYNGVEQEAVEAFLDAAQHADVWQKNYDKQFVAHDKTRQQRDDFKRQLDIANARLSRIAALETPSCANIGKRMAAVARGDDK